MSLHQEKFNKLSDICADIAQVFFGSVFISFALDRSKLEMIVSGLILSLLFWIASISLVKKTYESKH